MNRNVTRQFPLTHTDHVPFLSPFNACRAQSGKRHVAGAGGCVDLRQNEAQTRGVSSLDPGPGPGAEEPGQTLVLEAPDHARL